MADLKELIQTSGNEAKTLIKDNLLDLLNSAKSDAETLAKETAQNVEEWCKAKLLGEMDEDEFKSLLISRKRVIEQMLIKQEISSRSRLEKVTVGLIDMVLNKAMNVIL